MKYNFRPAIYFLATVACLFAAAPLLIAGTSPVDPQLDSRVFSEIQHLSQMQVKIAQLGLSKGVSSQVKDLAQDINDDFTGFEARVTQLAEQGGITLHDIDTADKSEAADLALDQNELDQLNSAQGADFDRAFMSVVTSESEFHINQLTPYLSQLKDADHQQLVSDVIAELNEHMSIAQSK